MTKVYKVGIYLRLSKEDERDTESGSITNQRAILLNYIKENNLTYIAEYVDDGVSGTTFNRLGFNRLLKDIETQKINMVITKDTSRLGRDHIEFGYYVEKYFPEHNVRYVAVCDNIDTDSNNNDLLLFKSAYNDMYVKDISNKIRASLDIKKRNGEFVGAYAPYGYQKSPTNKHQLIIDEYAADIVKKIYQLFIKGTSITKIATILTTEKIPIPSVYKNMNRGLKSKLYGHWTQRTITDILTNPTYTGHLTQGRSKKINYKSKKRIHTPKENWIIKEDSCPMIVSKSMFDLAQNIYNANKNSCSPKSNSTNILLKGLVYCEECQHTIGFRTIINKKNHTSRIYGNCNYYLKHRQFNGCTPHGLQYITFEQMIITTIQQLLSTLDQEKILMTINDYATELTNAKASYQELTKLQKEISLTDLKIDQLYNDKLTGLIDQNRYLRIYHQIIEETAKKKDRLTILQKQIEADKNINYQEIIRKKLNSSPDRYLLSYLIKKITIDEDNKITIYYKFKNPS